mgnify:CR=1 FL=1
MLCCFGSAVHWVPLFVTRLLSPQEVERRVAEEVEQREKQLAAAKQDREAALRQQNEDLEQRHSEAMSSLVVDFASRHEATLVCAVEACMPRPVFLLVSTCTHTHTQTHTLTPTLLLFRHLSEHGTRSSCKLRCRIVSRRS